MKFINGIYCITFDITALLEVILIGKKIICIESISTYEDILKIICNEIIMNVYLSLSK